MSCLTLRASMKAGPGRISTWVQERGEIFVLFISITEHTDFSYSGPFKKIHCFGNSKNIKLLDD